MRTRHRLGVVLAILLLVLALQVGTGPGAEAQVVVDVLTLGDDGGGVAVNPNTGRVYVAVPGHLNVYDAGSHALLSSVTLPQNYSACDGVAVNSTTNRIYAAGLRTYVVDGGSNTVLANLDVGGHELAVNPTTNRVYIGSWINYPYTDPYTVHVLDGTNNTWLPDISLGSVESFESIQLATNPTTNRVYVAFSGDDSLRVLDGSSHTEVANIPVANIGNVVVDPAANRIYVGVNYTDAEILDGSSHASLGTIAKIGPQLRLNSLTGRLYGVASTSVGYVLRIVDLASNKLDGYVHLDGNLEAYDIHPGLGKLFATHSTYPSTWSKKLTIIQDASPSGPAPSPTPPCIMTTVDLPASGDGVEINTTTNRLYVGMDGGVGVYDATTLAQLAFIDLSTGSYEPPIYDMGVDETLNRVYAVSVSKTWVISGANNQTIATLAGGDEIAVNAQNARVYIGDAAASRGIPDRLRIYNGATLANIRTIDLGLSIYYQGVQVAVNPTTGYAYCTYTLDDDLRIISPDTDDVATSIDYASSGDVAVNPATNRVYVWISRSGQSGALVLDGNTHAELGLLSGVSGQMAVDSLADRLYGYVGYTLFQGVDGTTGEVKMRVFLDGQISGFALHPGLRRLYATHSDYPAEWANKLTVIQDAGGPPEPTATPTSTPSPTPLPTRTATPVRTPTVAPSHWANLPLIFRTP